MLSSAQRLVGKPASQVATLSQGQSYQPHVVTAAVKPDVLALPAMDKLIPQVTDEVTKRLQPLLANLRSMVQQTQSPPTTSSQAPAEQATALQSTGSNIQQVQGLAAIQDAVEVPATHST